MKITGKVHKIGELELLGQNKDFKKQVLVVLTDEQYPQKIALEFYQDKCELLDKLTLKQEVEVDFNVRGNEYQGKFYVSLNGWRITTKESSTNAPVQLNQPDSDLPF